MGPITAPHQLQPTGRAAPADRPPRPAEPAPLTARAIRDLYPDSAYVAYNAPRYAMLLASLRRLHRPGAPVLDVGRSALTEMMARQLDTTVDTLGLQVDSETATGRHFQFELNRTQDEATWRRDLPRYQTIVFAEVLEHIHTAPTLVLRFLASILEPSGIIVVQTPNAVALHKRVQMLCGRNPYELFREDLSMPGHYREYTRAELLKFAEQCGFDVVEFTFGNYFDYRFRNQLHGPAPRRSGIVNWIYSMLPGPVKPGITMVLRKRGGGEDAEPARP